MSIGTAVLAVGKFLSGPIVTGAANVATFANLGLGIATKVDTSQIKSTVGGIRSDLNAVDNHILALTENIDDFRQENRWNVALAGGRPVVISGGGQPQYAQLQVQQPQQVQHRDRYVHPYEPDRKRHSQYGPGKAGYSLDDVRKQYHQIKQVLFHYR